MKRNEMIEIVKIMRETPKRKKAVSSKVEKAKQPAAYVIAKCALNKSFLAQCPAISDWIFILFYRRSACVRAHVCAV